ncbi:MAG: type II toxin-antitoxin system HicB family antitoxin [Synechocystis sp.]
MVTEFTVVYTPITSGYMGQLLEWPEVISEGETLETCRQSIQDALNEMLLVYHQHNQTSPAYQKVTVNN